MSAKNGAVKLVAGNSNLVLAREIGRWLGLELTKASVRRFADNEIFVEVLENVRAEAVGGKLNRRNGSVWPCAADDSRRVNDSRVPIPDSRQ